MLAGSPALLGLLYAGHRVVCLAPTLRNINAARIYSFLMCHVSRSCVRARLAKEKNPFDAGRVRAVIFRVKFFHAVITARTCFAEMFYTKVFHS